MAYFGFGFTYKIKCENCVLMFWTEEFKIPHTLNFRWQAHPNMKNLPKQAMVKARQLRLLGAAQHVVAI